MKMTFDAEACAAYIQLVPSITKVDDSWPLDGFISGVDDVIVDLDADCIVLGVDILGKDGYGLSGILRAVEDESIANVMALEGFECPQLRGNPEITVKRIG